MAVFGLSVVLMAISTGVIYWILNYIKLKKRLNGIHGPPSLPIIGNVHQIPWDPESFFSLVKGTSELYQKPRMYRAWMMWFPYSIIYGAEEAEKILTSNKHINKGREYRMLHPWLGLGLLTNYAEAWRPRRKLLTPTFHYEILKNFVDVFDNQAKYLVKLLEAKADGKEFDMYPFITLCALDIICETSMGRNVGAQKESKSDYVTAIYKINDIISHRQREPWFWLNPLFNWFGRGKEHKWCLDVIHGFSNKVIGERKAELDQIGGLEQMAGSKGPRLAFLDLLLDMVDKGTLPMADVQSEVDTFMFEGHDTTSAGMNWALLLLGWYPEIQAKVHKEIDEVLGYDDSNVGFERLKELPYLECVIKEALRLFPSVPMFARTLEEDCPIGENIIPAKTQVLIVPYIVHRDPEYWPDPEKFDPDRFLPDNTVGRHPYAYLPFSAGSRNCIGQRFAIMEEKTVLAWILRYYRIIPTVRRDQMNMRPELILRPTQGCPVKLEMRRKPNFDIAD